jgi:phosphoglycolate phosphatase
MRKENKRYIIFDFDGTLADSEKVILEVINILLKKEGKDLFSEQDFKNLRKMSSEEAVKSFNVSWWKLPFFVRKAKKMMANRMNKVCPIAGIKEVLINLRKKGCVLILLTSNSRENINLFLGKNKMDFFSEIFCNSTLFGKARVFKKIIRKNNLIAGEVFSIGDETRDIQAAKKVGFKSVAVAWGLTSKDVLAKFKPEYLVEKPHELLEIFPPYDK